MRGAKPRRGSLLYKLAYAVLFGVFLSTVAEGAERTWTGADVANDPSWANGKNWQGETAPGAGDGAYFPATLGDGEVVVSDADAALVSSLSNIRGDSVSKVPKVVFSVTTNFALKCQIARLTVVKRQESSMELVRDEKDYRTMSAIVEKGSLVLPRTQSASGYWNMDGLVVSNGASVFLPDAITKKSTLVVGTLYCAGLLTNANAKVKQGLRIMSATDAAPARFTETAEIGGLVYFESVGQVVVESERMSFTGDAKVWTTDGAAEPASLTVRKIGRSDDAESSLGRASDPETSWGFGYNGGVWRYAGTGETTDRQLCYSIDWYNYNPYYSPTFDAGACGGVTFIGKWLGARSYRSGTIYADTFDFVLTGSNTVPCVLANEIAPVESDGAERPFYIVKQGSGVWRFNDHESRRNNGVVAVEEGTLQFETIAAKGEVCSLGTADALQERYFGVYDATRNVDYAYLLGTETTEGTMEHVGTNDAACADRPFRLAGDGRLKASGGRLALSDVSAQTAGEKTLTLDGTNSVKNTIACVTNGAGTVSLTKDGTGTWRLSGDCDVSGDLTVKAGTLEVAGAGVPYSYYRFTSYETLGAAAQANYCFQTVVDELALFSADGVRRNLDLVWDVEPHATAGYYATDVDVPALQPGHASYAYSAKWYYYKDNDYGMDKLWNGTTDAHSFIAWNASATKPETAPTYEEPSRRVSLVMRLPEGTPEIARYDFCSGSVGDGSATNQLPKVFMLEGSVDGECWVVLHFKADQTKLSGKGRWCSDDTPFNTQYTNRGFVVTGRTTFGEQLASVRSISVAAGATLKADGPVAPIRGLKVSASGAGTIDGFTFAASTEVRPCTLDVANVPSADAKVVLPGTYANCQGLDKVTEWNLLIDGRPSRRYTICHKNGTLTLVKNGLVLVVR